MDFEQSKSDYSLFTQRTIASFLALLVYVDDVLVIGDSFSEIIDVKRRIDQAFTIKDLGEVRFFLRIEICCIEHGFFA